MDLGRILNDYTTDPLAPSTPATTSTAATFNQRTGKWSDEEERYASTLVRYFVAGSLTIPTGTSLRGYLAKKLRCSAMRVSTKLSMDVLGDLKIPKKLGQKRFFPMEGLTKAHQQCVANELSSLEAAFLQKENLQVEREERDSDSVITRAKGATSTGNASSDRDEETDCPMRVGSWSEEEQGYACELLDAFLHGLVNAAEGTTLRVFLAERLCCNPMRISKKLATGKMGGRVIPKRLGSAIYRRAVPFEPWAVSRTEYHLERVRFSCFSTASQPRQMKPPVCTVSAQPPRVHIYSEPLSHDQSACVYTPPARSQLRVFSSLPIGNSSQQQTPSTTSSGLPVHTSMSPLPSEMKRKLPFLELPSTPYLPSLAVGGAPTGMKKARFTPLTTIATHY